MDTRLDSAPTRTAAAVYQHLVRLGAGDPETQLREAKKLELVLRSGALPAPVGARY